MKRHGTKQYTTVQCTHHGDMLYGDMVRRYGGL